jgi:hypothetical protein
MKDISRGGLLRLPADSKLQRKAARGCGFQMRCARSASYSLSGSNQQDIGQVLARNPHCILILDDRPAGSTSVPNLKSMPSCAICT